MQMKFNQETFLVKYILISLSILFIVGCSKEAGYNTLENISKNNCRNIVNAQERLNCENKEKSSYKEYKKYYESK